MGKSVQSYFSLWKIQPPGPWAAGSRAQPTPSPPTHLQRCGSWLLARVTFGSATTLSWRSPAQETGRSASRDEQLVASGHKVESLDMDTNKQMSADYHIKAAVAQLPKPARPPSSWRCSKVRVLAAATRCSSWPSNTASRPGAPGAAAALNRGGAKTCTGVRGREAKEHAWVPWLCRFGSDGAGAACCRLGAQKPRTCEDACPQPQGACSNCRIGHRPALQASIRAHVVMRWWWWRRGNRWQRCSRGPCSHAPGAAFAPPAHPRCCRSCSSPQSAVRCAWWKEGGGLGQG